MPKLACPAQLPANLVILYVGAPNLLAVIICLWGTVGAATGAPLDMPAFKTQCMKDRTLLA